MTAPTNNLFSANLAFGSVLTTSQVLETRMTNDGSGNILYVGVNQTPNAATSSGTWMVWKYSYTGGFMVRQQLPNNGVGFFYIWDDVSTYFS
jgi:hypothetical protein